MSQRGGTVRRGIMIASIAAAHASTSSAVRADVTKAQCAQADVAAQDLRREGRMSAARESLRKCADLSCPGIVRDDCTRRLDELDKAQPTIVFEAKDNAGKDLTAVKVTMDGKPLADSLTGSALPVDPGAHSFTFEVVGQAPITQQFVLNEGEKWRHERVAIGGPISPASVASKLAATPQAVPASAEPGTTSLAEGPRSSGGGGSQRTVGLVVGGVGIASLAAGAIFGGLSIAAHSSYEEHCGSNIGAPAGLCDAQGVTEHGDAATRATLSTIFFAAGGAAMATGAILYFTAPSGEKPTVGLGPATLLVRGQFQ